MLGTVLSDLVGRAYSEIVDAVVCRPLGLTRTALQPPLTSTPAHLAWWRHVADAKDDGPAGDEATPYRQESTVQRPVAADHWNSTGALAASGGIVSTGRDMIRFLAAALDFGAGAAAPVFRLTQQLVPAADPALPHLGMAWQFRESKLPGQLLAKNGSTRGMHTFIGIRPAPGPYGRSGVVMLSNSHNQIDNHALGILAEVGRMRSRHA